ncbi:hypothetical protein BC936DRAFT_137338 [Jimgerdemannia flammicorona]|uniref:Uncharacterized protein n=1 Tax=Jimgerdemannia flammicorona TaxID=994334 RepID=A0A433CXL7_9FUNG|nr:hypothetical protein BC936DRAFT_137338 [Jimgerdemannia flammicorona]
MLPIPDTPEDGQGRSKNASTQALVDFLNTTGPEEFKDTHPKRVTTLFFRGRKKLSFPVRTPPANSGKNYVEIVPKIQEDLNGESSVNTSVRCDQTVRAAASNFTSAQSPERSTVMMDKELPILPLPSPQKSRIRGAAVEGRINLGRTLSNATKFSSARSMKPLSLRTEPDKISSIVAPLAAPPHTGGDASIAKTSSLKTRSMTSSTINLPGLSEIVSIPNTSDQKCPITSETYKRENNLPMSQILTQIQTQNSYDTNPVESKKSERGTDNVEATSYQNNDDYSQPRLRNASHQQEEMDLVEAALLQRIEVVWAGMDTKSPSGSTVFTEVEEHACALHETSLVEIQAVESIIKETKQYRRQQDRYLTSHEMSNLRDLRKRVRHVQTQTAEIVSKKNAYTQIEAIITPDLSNATELSTVEFDQSHDSSKRHGSHHSKELRDQIAALLQALARMQRSRKRLVAGMKDSRDKFETLSSLAYRKLRDLWEEKCRWEEEVVELRARLGELEGETAELRGRLSELQMIHQNRMDDKNYLNMTSKQGNTLD